MKTKVFLTIDTEFSIGGTFADPKQNHPVGTQAVYCRIGSKSHGLDLLLNVFREFDIAATFFVEALNVNYFGDEPMCGVAKAIAAAGHDVQLHLHPCWTYFKNPDWRNLLEVSPPSDHMHSRSLGQLVSWMQEGIQTFERWGVGRPAALRTGSMMADRTVYRAMEDVGLGLASNLGLAMYRPLAPELHIYSGIQRIGKVLELCVTTYADMNVFGRRHFRSLTITGASWGETRALLLAANAAGVGTIVLLTHPFEFVKYSRPDFEDLRPNGINQDRLLRLCNFIRDNPERFEATTFRSLHDHPGDVQTSENIVLDVPIRHTLSRMALNSLNNMSWIP